MPYFCVRTNNSVMSDASSYITAPKSACESKITHAHVDLNDIIHHCVSDQSGLSRRSGDSRQ